MAKRVVRTLEAHAFCAELGAVDVREVLEDDEILLAFAAHLQLKRLEVRRCHAASSCHKIAINGNQEPSMAILYSFVVMKWLLLPVNGHLMAMNYN